jgi:uncharacterized protein (DUF1778 family)
MTSMVIERLEVRLDPEHRKRLAAVAAAQGKQVSDVVRQMIDQAYEDIRRQERVRAARELGEFAIEDVPDPDVLKRQFEGAYELPDLH